MNDKLGASIPSYYVFEKWTYFFSKIITHHPSFILYFFRLFLVTRLTLLHNFSISKLDVLEGISVIQIHVKTQGTVLMPGADSIALVRDHSLETLANTVSSKFILCEPNRLFLCLILVFMGCVNKLKHASHKLAVAYF